MEDIEEEACMASKVKKNFKDMLRFSKRDLSLGVPKEREREREKNKIHPMLQLSKEGHVQDKCLKLKKGMETTKNQRESL